MAFYKPPRKGQTVRLTFEGVVFSTTLHSVRLVNTEGGHNSSTYVGWGSRATPIIEILDEGLRAGDIGVYTYDSGAMESVVYRSGYKSEEDEAISEGWYRGYAPESPRLAAPNDKHVRLVLRADGTPVKEE